MASSSLRSSAWRRQGAHDLVDVAAYSAAENVASILAATVAVDDIQRGAWLVVADGLVAWTPILMRGTIHKPMRVHLLPQIMVRQR